MPGFRLLSARSLPVSLLLLALTACAAPQRPIVEPADRATLVEDSGGGTDGQREAPGVNHVVLPRQTLWRIAQAYGKTVNELVQANSIDNPDELPAGRILFIPGATAEIYVAPYPGPAESAASGGVDPMWSWPVPGGEAISSFGTVRRTHRHRGLDIRGRAGQDVVAVRGGLVVFSGSMRGYGKTVIVDHEDGFRSLYGHNSRIVVSGGKRIRQGETIAEVGRTGDATTDHCHLEIYRDGVAIDPTLYVSRAAGDRR